MPDGIDDVTRREAALKRMSEMFPVNRGLQPAYVAMARAHRYAIDYIEQAPVIVLAATAGDTRLSPNGYKSLQEQFRRMCESGARLRDVMRAYGLPLPLRLLDARVLTSSRASVVRWLALINPSTLAQIIPKTREEQNAWLRALDNWCRWMAARCGAKKGPYPFFEWAATNYPGITYGESWGVRQMVDFARAHADTFNPRWTLKRARAEQKKWHEQLVMAEVAKSTGASPDTVVHYLSLPLFWERDGFSFVALQTGKALQIEGAAMHHCVATYWRNVLNGESRIYSILENGSRVATLELINRPLDRTGYGRIYQVSQLVGAGNSRTNSNVCKAVGNFVAEINDPSQQSAAA